jgi:Tfp pilus assembly major pilin PilA
MKNSQRGFIGIILVLVIAIAAIGGGTYAYTQRKNTTKQIMTDSQVSSEVKVAKTEDKPATEVVTYTKHVETDSPGLSAKADMTISENCGYKDCFQQKFKACEPAVTTANIGIGAVEYKILGKGTTGCNVTFKYTNYPDPTWVNKEMTCEFNNKVSFDDAMKPVFSGTNTTCKGPFYDIIRQK